jgi:hypothetical protein
MLLRAAATGTRAFVNQTPSWPKGASLRSGEKHPACFRVKPVDMLRHFAGGIPESEVQSAVAEYTPQFEAEWASRRQEAAALAEHVTVYAEGV